MPYDLPFEGFVNAGALARDLRTNVVPKKYPSILPAACKDQADIARGRSYPPSHTRGKHMLNANPILSTRRINPKVMYWKVKQNLHYGFKYNMCKRI